MEIHKSSDPNSLCRCCLHLLDPTKQFPDVFLITDLAKKLALVTSLTVEPQDRFPKHLCDSCFNNVNDFHQFQAMCVESVQRFSEILKSKDSGFEDEDQLEFDLNGQMKIEITVTEPDIIFESLSRESEAESEDESLRKPMKNNRLPKKAIKKISEKRKTRSSTLKQKADVYVEDEVPECPEDRVSSDEGGCDDIREEQKQSVDSEDEFLAPKGKKDQSSSNDDVSKRKYHKRNSEQSPGDAKSKPSVFQCDVCPTRFFVEHRLIAHKRGHEGLAPYPCPRDGCDKSFNRWYCLSEHLKQHEGTNRWYKCEENGCGKVYKHKPTLAMHLRKCHKRGPELKSHVCEICGKVFKASAILNDHRYTHKDKSELPYACDQPQCQRRFSNKEKLKVHMMRHAGIKNFVCPYCGMRKTTRNELRTHINYHTLERRWPCRFCAHVCNSAGNLKMHVRTVHERARDYACRFCERTFAKPDTRKYHEMTHTGEKPNECTECGKRFTQPAALRTHKKIHQRLTSIMYVTEAEGNGSGTNPEGGGVVDQSKIPNSSIGLFADVVSNVTDIKPLL